MSKLELIARELDRMPEQDLDTLLAFLRSLREGQAENATLTLAAGIVTGQGLAHT